MAGVTSSPIDRLATEILELIFLEAGKSWCRVSGRDMKLRWSEKSKNEEELRCSPALDMKSFPWVAGQVSSRWRQIALCFPEMWSQVWLELPRLSQRPMPMKCGIRGPEMLWSPSYAQILEEHLLRAKNFPLQVTIIVDFQFLHPESLIYKAIPKLLSIIGAHSEKWKDAFLFIENETMTQALFNQVNGHVPSLEIWKLYKLFHPITNIVAPSLREFVIRGTSCIQAFPQWAQLERITIHRDSASNEEIFGELSVLQGSEQLQELDIRQTGFNHPSADLKFDHLRLLRCYPWSLDVFHKLPALTSLQVYPTLGENLSGFIKRASPLALTTLILPPLPASSDTSGFKEILNMLPMLQELTMDRVAKSDTWFALMAFMRADLNSLDRTPIPRLQHLSVNYTSYGGDFWEGILPWINMVESRFSPQYAFPRLRSIEISGTAADSDLPGVKMRLGELERQGLEILQLWIIRRRRIQHGQS
ncbi:hypothetical protein C8J56DRAFT_1058881 [Mycena floridula]|nr:hypothetical protein C8J56DRAFT_1058881 [Mycena floridula]